MTQDEVASRFQAFLARRARLNQAFNESQEAIDVWLERTPLSAPITALAQLEVLLKDRRDVIQELIDLDDGFIEYISSA